MVGWRGALAQVTGKPALVTKDPAWHLLDGGEKYGDNDDQTKV